MDSIYFKKNLGSWIHEKYTHNFRWTFRQSEHGAYVTITAQKTVSIGELNPINVSVQFKTVNDETQIILCVQHMCNEVLKKIQ